MSDTNTSGSAPVKKNITRRDVLAMAGCGVAGLVVGGALASWGVTQESIASGRIELRTTPTKMIVTDRARCSGCQRCEMMCTLKNDGRVCQHIARVRVWDNYYWGKSADTGDGSFGDGKGACEFTVEHCKQCKDAKCMEYCPVHAIHADEETGARVVDADVVGVEDVERGDDAAVERVLAVLADVGDHVAHAHHTPLERRGAQLRDVGFVPGAGLHGAPGSIDIIHQQHALAGQIRARVADKCAPGILQALGPGQLLLRAGARAD